MKTLRKGDTGPEVRTLQEKLAATGYPLPAGVHFGAKTDTAVRNFQRKKTLLADGIVGAKTWLALGVKDAATARPKPANGLTDWLSLLGAIGVYFAASAKNAPASLASSRPASQLNTSHNGLLFIYTREAWAGRSNVLHWPGGSSGVTLGPGYDMKERTEAAIAKDMQAIGVPAEKAKEIAKGAGLKGDSAKKFAADNSMKDKELIKLRNEDEFKLLKMVVPAYEAQVRNRITANLLQHEFDALVSFAYNIGSVPPAIANLINRGKIRNALTEMKTRNTSGGKVDKGLIKRRELEVTLYCFGDYGKLSVV